MRKFLIALSLIAFSKISLAATILVMGDSISAGYGLEIDQGWVALLQQKFIEENQDHRVVNASISGDTSAGGLARLDANLERYKPAIVIIELGGNDGLRGLSPKRMKANLSEMIKRSRAAGARVLLLGMRIPPNYGKRYAELFHQVYYQLEEEYRIAFVPFLLEDVALEKAFMQHDGIHPNSKAQAIIANRVWQQLEPMLN